jgi:cell wall-associated NlpC family hydrolase
MVTSTMTSLPRRKRNAPSMLDELHRQAGFSAGDVNLYRYVGNNPTNQTDPTGLCSRVSGLSTSISGLVYSSNTSISSLNTMAMPLSNNVVNSSSDWNSNTWSSITSGVYSAYNSVASGGLLNGGWSTNADLSSLNTTSMITYVPSSQPTSAPSSMPSTPHEYDLDVAKGLFMSGLEYPGAVVGNPAPIVSPENNLIALNTYKAFLQKTYDSTSSATEKNILKDLTGNLDKAIVDYTDAQRTTPANASDATRIKILNEALGQFANQNSQYIIDAYPTNKYQCNVFVGNVSRNAGVNVDVAGPFSTHAPGAAEWANGRVPKYAEVQPDQRQPGDIISYDDAPHRDQHVGIYVGGGLYVSATTRTKVAAVDQAYPILRLKDAAVPNLTIRYWRPR